MEYTSQSLKTHNGEVTLYNPETGNHRTFRVRTQPQDSEFAPGKRVLALLTGPDNTSAYTPLGFVEPNGHIRLWSRKRSKLNYTYVKMLTVPNKWRAKGIEYKFSERCRICNRKLTTPESIERGIGPVCAEKGF